MRRNEIWIAHLNPRRGGEARKTRPVLILQENAITDAGIPTVLVVPLTTQLRPSLKPLRIRIPMRDRLLKDCFVIVEQILALDRNRFGEGPLTILTAEEMMVVEKSMLGVLGVY